MNKRTFLNLPSLICCSAGVILFALNILNPCFGYFNGIIMLIFVLSVLVFVAGIHWNIYKNSHLDELLHENLHHRKAAAVNFRYLDSLLIALFMLTYTLLALLMYIVTSLEHQRVVLPGLIEGIVFFILVLAVVCYHNIAKRTISRLSRQPEYQHLLEGVNRRK